MSSFWFWVSTLVLFLAVAVAGSLVMRQVLHEVTGQ